MTYSSNALEGNSLTETETKILIEDGLTAGGKPIRDYYEATGHARAYDYIYTIAQGEHIGEEQIKTIHRLFYSQIDMEKAGDYRQERVIITGSAYPAPAPDKIPSLMSSFVRWLAQTRINAIRLNLQHKPINALSLSTPLLTGTAGWQDCL